MRFTYEGPFDAVDVHLVVKRGESIDVPDGAGLFAQPDAWSPDKAALSSLTVPQLEERASTLSVDVSSGAKKADLVDSLLAYSTNPRDTATEEV